MVSLYEAVLENLLGTSPPGFVSRLLLQLSRILLNVRPACLTRVVFGRAESELEGRHSHWR